MSKLDELAITFGEDYFTGKTSNYQGYPSDLVAPVHIERVQAILALNPTSVLDVGAANGVIVEAIYLQGIPAKGVEVSKYLIDSTTPLRKELVVWASAQEMPFADNTFDVVTSGDLLEHIPEAEIEQVIKELKRVGRRQFHDIYTGLNPHDADQTHINVKPLDYWQKLFGKEAILRETKP